MKKHAVTAEPVRARLGSHGQLFSPLRCGTAEKRKNTSENTPISVSYAVNTNRPVTQAAAAPLTQNVGFCRYLLSDEAFSLAAGEVKHTPASG